jgi:hypothetical protein
MERILHGIQQNRAEFWKKKKKKLQEKNEWICSLLSNNAVYINVLFMISTM